MGGKRRIKQIARYLFNRSDSNPEHEELKIAQIIMASLVILGEMQDDKRKDQFRWELRMALARINDINSVTEPYQQVDSDKDAVRLYNDVTDIANNRWHDPGRINKYFISTSLALGQASGYGIAVTDHLSRKDQKILAKILGPCAFLANLYFSYDSLPNINSNIIEDTRLFLRNRRDLNRKQILKLFAKQSFGALCAACAAMVDVSFIVDSRDFFGNQDIIYCALLTLAYVTMALIYKDSLDVLIDKIPKSSEWSSELQQNIQQFKVFILAQPLSCLVSAVTAFIALNRVCAFTYGTYKNYEVGFGVAGAAIVATLSAIPSTCLVVSSTNEAKDFFIKRFHGSKGYVRQSDKELNVINQSRGRVSLSDMLLRIIASGVFLGGAASTASLIDSSYWFVFCVFCVSAAIFARGYIAKIKTIEEVERQENFVNSIKSMTKEEARQRIREFQQNNAATISITPDNVPDLGGASASASKASQAPANSSKIQVL
jgi:hypothetical protein